MTYRAKGHILFANLEKREKLTRQTGGSRGLKLLRDGFWPPFPGANELTVQYSTKPNYTLPNITSLNQTERQWKLEYCRIEFGQVKE